MQVFSLGNDMSGPSGLPGLFVVEEPTEIYTGFGEYCLQQSDQNYTNIDMCSSFE